jgi:hypothetical protein
LALGHAVGSTVHIVKSDQLLDYVIKVVKVLLLLVVSDKFSCLSTLKGLFWGLLLSNLKENNLCQFSTLLLRS